jgi:hypothetical protein
VVLSDTLTLQQVAAGLAMDTGDLAQAAEWLTANDRWLAWSGAVLGQVEGHLDWARYYLCLGDRVAAEAQARLALDKANAPRQPLGLLASHRLLGQLATERGDAAVADDLLSEALTLADACQSPYERALTLVAQAELALATGSNAHEMLAEARAICERLEARPTLERIVALERKSAGG